MDDIAAELREDNREVTLWLVYYPERKKATDLMREEIIERTPAQSGDRVSSSTISDPAYQRAEELVRKTAVAQSWLETVDMVKRMIGTKKLLLLELRQREVQQPITCNRRGKPGWIIWVQRHWAEEYSKATGIPDDCCWLSDSMIRKYWADIVTLTARLAAKRGLLNK